MLEWPRLEELVAAACTLEKFPMPLVQFTALVSLTLSDNHIDTLPAAIVRAPCIILRLLIRVEGRLVHLECLRLDKNCLSTLPAEVTDLVTCALLIPFQIGSLRKLEELTVALNHTLSSLPRAVGNLRALLVLDAHDCCLVPISHKSEVSHCLVYPPRRIDLSGAPSGSRRWIQPSSLAASAHGSLGAIGAPCSSLRSHYHPQTSLVLRDNSLSELPLSLGLCQALTSLDVLGNPFQAFIVASFQHL